MIHFFNKNIMKMNYKMHLNHDHVHLLCHTWQLSLLVPGQV